MKAGIELIAIERKEQIEKHGRTVNDDVQFNDQRQLVIGAKRLLEDIPDPYAIPCDWSPEIWKKMCFKRYRERLIIAGALIAAEIDRVQSITL